MVINTPTSEPEPVFFAGSLSTAYREGDAAVHALRGVDLDILRGEIMVQPGASGSGQSTLGTTTVMIRHNAPIADMALRVLRLADGLMIVDTRVDPYNMAASSLRW